MIKIKKKSYWIEVKKSRGEEVYEIFLRGRNKFGMVGDYGCFYYEKRKAVQQAKRLAKALRIEYRGVK